MPGWLVEDEGIEPHIPVSDKSERKDGAFPAIDFVYDRKADAFRRSARASAVIRNGSQRSGERRRR